MAKSIPAIVTPEVLQWARSLDRITLEEIALKLKVEVAKVEAWENGSEYPSLIQAILLSNIVCHLLIFICPILRKKPNAWKRLITELLATGAWAKCLANCDGF